MSSFDMTENTIERSEGPSLFFRHHLSKNEKARMVIVHGLGEHSGRYSALAKRLVELDISVWILDLRGHGKSGGQQGHVESFDDYTRDVMHVMDRALADKPAGSKCFLLGHSMGGLVAILFALEHQNLIDGLAVSSPALGVAAPVPAIKKIGATLLSRIFPRLGIKNEIDPQNISHDPEIVKKYMDDPLVHNRVSTAWYIQFVKAMEKAHSRAAGINIPILVQAAGEDRLVSTKAVVAFFESLTVPDQSLRVYNGLYHEIYNELEPDRKKVISELTDWLSERIDR